jgi:acyl-CoA synthetase (NDP forming)
MDAVRKETFDRLFSPESLALVGISKDERTLGQFFFRNLNRAGYPGRIYLVNPSVAEINGQKSYPDISALPECVDLAVVCIPARLVPEAVGECARKGICNVHIFSSGFQELGTPGGRQLEEEIRRLACGRPLNVIGPNCMGAYVPASKLTMWGQVPAKPGSFAFLSQSGSLTQRMTEYAHFMGIGISKAVSFGNAAVLDSPDYLEYLAEDEGTRVIGFYLEGVKDGRRFLEIARRVNRMKPLVVWKGGESGPGAGAAASHTGALSGEDRIWESALQQIGAARVRSLEQVAGTAMAFLHLPQPAGRRLFILGGGGGNSVSYADICRRLGFEIPPLAGETKEKITALVPEVGSFARNPVDAWRAFFDPAFMAEILEAVFADPGLDMIILDRLIPRLTYMTQENPKNIPAVLEYLKKNRGRKPLVAVVDGSGEDDVLALEAVRLRRAFCEAGIPAYPSLSLAGQALGHVAAYYERQKGLCTGMDGTGAQS